MPSATASGPTRARYSKGVTDLSDSGLSHEIIRRFLYRSESPLDAAASALNIDVSSITEPDTVFQAAFSIVRKTRDTAGRLDTFIILYGFNRNVSAVSVIACCMFLIRAALEGDSGSFCKLDYDLKTQLSR